MVQWAEEKDSILLSEYYFLQSYMKTKAPFVKLGAVYDHRNNEYCITLYQTSNVKNTRYTLTECRGQSLEVCLIKVDAFVRGLLKAK